MSIFDLLLLACLVATCAIATLYDCRSFTIPNWLCYGAFAMAFSVLGIKQAVMATNKSWHDAAGLPVGLGEGIVGALLCGVTLLPFWLAEKAGAGDVKLMAVIGLILSPFHGISVLFAGSLLAVAWVIGNKGIRIIRPRLAMSGKKESEPNCRKPALRVFRTIGARHLFSARSLTTAEDVKQAQIPMAGHYSLATILVMYAVL